MIHLLTRLYSFLTATGQRKRRARPQLGIESLEDRSVPATLQIVNGVLAYTAGAGVANNLTISTSVVGYIIRDTAETINVIGIPGASGSGTNTIVLYGSDIPAAGLSINLGDRNDRLTIDSTVDPIAVKGGADADLIDIGRFGSGHLSGIVAPVTLDGEGGTDTVRLNDQANPLNRDFTITGTQVTATDMAAVLYAGLENVTINASEVTTSLYADVFYIYGTAAGTRTTINGNVGNDRFRVGNAANTLDDLLGPLVLNGGSQIDPHDTLGPHHHIHGDSVQILDQGSSARSYTVRVDNSVARSGGAFIAYSGLEGVFLNTGNFADSIAVLGTTAGTPLYIDSGDGNDRITLDVAGGSLDNFNERVIVNGGLGIDTIIVNDQGDTNANSYGVSATEVWRGWSPFYLSYAGAESLTLNAGNFDDHVYVQSTLATTPITLKMGGGNDTVVVGSEFSTLDTILAGLTVDGQVGLDRLELADQGSTPMILNQDGTEYIPIDYTVTATTVARTQAATVTYAGLEDLVLNAAATPFLFFTLIPFSSEGNDILVKGTALNTATVINVGFYGVYTVTVGSDGRSLDPIRGALTVNSLGGVTALVLNDQGDSNANACTITSDQVARAGSAPIFYNLENLYYPTAARLTLNAGAFGDTVTVLSTAAAVPVTLNLGAGNDIIILGGSNTPNPLSQLDATVIVNGEGGKDAIILENTDNGTGPLWGSSYSITAMNVKRNSEKILVYDTVESLTLNAGRGSDLIAVTSTRAETPVRIQGGLGDDTFRLDGSGTLAGAVTFDGQGGSDTLDYSLYPAEVRVNLALGSATGIVGGVSNVENVTGSAANDILVGNDLDNVLRGGAGRDILIGRGGADQLLGEAGDDILIGGSTAHDLNTAALEDLLREWGRNDLWGWPVSQYGQRINHLLGVIPGGLNGTTILNLNQVSDDGIADILDGGSELDWYFILGADGIPNGLEPWERVN